MKLIKNINNFVSEILSLNVDLTFSIKEILVLIWLITLTIKICR